MVVKKDLDRAKKARDIRKAAKQSICEITPQMIMLSVICVMGAAGLMILTIYFGIDLGIKSIESESNVIITRDNEDYEAVRYESEEIAYSANSDCIDGSDNSKCLLDVYGAKNTNYVVIKSSDQYHRFVDLAQNLVGATVNMTIDDDYFRTGNVIAVVKEDENVANYSLKHVERNSNYGLRIKIQQDVLSGDAEASETGHLILVKVPNIQSTDIEIVEQE